MEFTHKVEDNILNITIKGDLLGTENEPKMLDDIQEHIERKIIYCTVDISGIGYMNSTGLSLLIRLLTRFRNQGGELVLINPSEQVQQLLVITKLNAIFSVVNSLEEANKFFEN